MKTRIIAITAFALGLLVIGSVQMKAAADYYLVLERYISDSVKVTHTVKVMNGKFSFPKMEPGTYRISLVAIGDPTSSNGQTPSASLHKPFRCQITLEDIIISSFSSGKNTTIAMGDGSVTVLNTGSPAPGLGVSTSRSNIRTRNLNPTNTLTINRGGTVNGIIAILIGL